jgi:hypothetical protein
MARTRRGRCSWLAVCLLSVVIVVGLTLCVRAVSNGADWSPLVWAFNVGASVYSLNKEFE